MSGSEFVEGIVGVGAARVRDLFKRARVQESPCIIFVDEIDAMGTRRANAGTPLSSLPTSSRAQTPKEARETIEASGLATVVTALLKKITLSWRGWAGEHANEEREQTLNQLLSEMDGFTPDVGVIFVGATNRSDLLDPALMRAGRFDRKFTIGRPDTQGRFEVLQARALRPPHLAFWSCLLQSGNKHFLLLYVLILFIIYSVSI